MESEGFAILIVLLIILGIYLVPTIVAICRKADYAAAAIIINIFLGWSFLGWVLALVLALINEPKRAAPQHIVINQVVGDKNTLSKSKKTVKDEDD